MNIGKCKLCLREIPLLNKSHIIPDFMYEFLFDEKKKIRRLDLIAMSKGQSRVEKPSSGEYEAGILCECCDRQIIGRYETYASKLFEKGLPDSKSPRGRFFKTPDGQLFSQFTNIDCATLKLFLLSILWRAGISSRPMFQEVSLGKHQEILRQMILNGDPGGQDDYPIFLMTYRHDKSTPIDLITQPRKARTRDGLVVYPFLITGTFYNFFVNSTSHRVPAPIDKAINLQENSILFLHISGKKALELAMRYLGIPFGDLYKTT